MAVRTPASSGGATARSTRSYIWRHSGGLDTRLPPARAGRLPEVLRCAHFAAEDLAGRALGQIGLDPDVTRVFIGCYPVLHERAQFAGSGGSGRPELQVLLPVHNVEIAVLVDSGQVACLQ